MPLSVRSFFGVKKRVCAERGEMNAVDDVDDDRTTSRGFYKIEMTVQQIDERFCIVAGSCQGC